MGKRIFWFTLSLIVLITIGVYVEHVIPNNIAQESITVTIVHECAEVDSTFVPEPENIVFPMVIEHPVTATVYNAVPEQCDDSPNVTADGTKFDPTIAGSYRYCALSRDLLKRWGGPYDYGEVVLLKGAGPLNGKWVVRDTMNKRHTNRIDLLVDLDMQPYKFRGAKIRKVL